MASLLVIPYFSTSVLYKKEVFQNYSKATTLEFCFATICDKIQTMKYFVFISNQLIWESDCSFFVLVFWHNLSICFLIKFVLTKLSMIFKIFYDHTDGSKVLFVLYFAMSIKKMGCAISRHMTQRFTVQQCMIHSQIIETILNYA